MQDKIGKMQERVIFTALVETNTSGSLVQTWPANSPPDEVSAEVIGARGSEALEAARINARETIRVRVRYRSDLTTQHRLYWRGNNYDVKHIDYTARREGYLWLTAEANGVA